MSSRYKTPPPPPPAFSVGNEAILRVAVDPKDIFPIGKRVTIKRVGDMNTTGVTRPVTSENARYKVAVGLIKEVDVPEAKVHPQCIPHKDLRADPTHRTAPEHIINDGERVYVGADWSYSHQGRTIVIRKGQKIEVQTAQTRSGKVASNTTGAFYPFSAVAVERRQVEEVTERWVVHDHLRAL